MKIKQILILALIVVVAVSWFLFDFGQYLSLDYLRESRDDFLAGYRQAPGMYALVYFVLYVLVTALSVPGAAVMTLAGGAIFGFATGLLLVSFASALGATLAMLIARSLLRDWVQHRYGNRLEAINEGIRKDGLFYLFTLRMIPIFPFFVINLLMGLTPMKVVPYYLVSQVGMLAGTVVYVFAGVQLATVEDPGDLLSWQLLLAFAAVGVLPLVARKFIEILKARRSLKGFQKPRKFDDNLIVIGAGSAGLIASLIAATVKAKVSLIERHKMGGDCLNTGCVPSKTLIRSSKVAQTMRNAETYGMESVSPKVNFHAVMERVQAAIRKIEPNDSVERYTRLGVNCIQGEAHFVDPWTVEVNGQKRTARKIIIATGGQPFVPPIPGVDKVRALTSDSFWELRELPQRFIVVGGGPIGCELSQAMSRLGSEVTIVNGLDRIMPREDTDVSDYMRRRMETEGIKILTNHNAKEFRDDHTLVVECEDGLKELEFDGVLIAAGRRPQLSGLGIDKIGLELTNRGTIAVNEYMQTNIPHIYTCGDVTGPYQFTHMASHQAWFATVNALFGGFRKFKANYKVVPWCTYTDPEVARVGLNETEARAKGVDFELTTFEFAESDRAIAEGADTGFIKVLTPPNSDRVLGVTIVGLEAGELIAEYVLAMTHGLPLKKIMSTIHTYPTMSEINKLVASAWRRRHAPEGMLKFSGRLLAWLRG